MGGADLSLKEGAVVHEAIRYADHMPRLERPEEDNCARCVGLAGEDEGITSSPRGKGACKPPVERPNGRYCSIAQGARALATS